MFGITPLFIHDVDEAFEAGNINDLPDIGGQLMIALFYDAP